MTYSDPERKRTYQREYARTEKRKASVRKYNQSEKGKVKNRAQGIRWRKENREKWLASMKKHDLKRHYGLTPEQYEAMWAAQGMKCAACGSTNPGRKNGQWSLDHCHGTKKVREIVCNGCNLALGHVKDSVERLQQLIEYLDAHHDSDKTRPFWRDASLVGFKITSGWSVGLLS
jgi:hypothetical protein